MKIDWYRKLLFEYCYFCMALINEVVCIIFLILKSAPKYLGSAKGWVCWQHHYQPCKNVPEHMTSSNGSIFRITGLLYREFTGHRWIPHIMASDAELWCFFDLCLNKRLSKQSWGWWFKTPSRSLWCQCNAWASIELMLLALDQYRPGTGTIWHVYSEVSS